MGKKDHESKKDDNVKDGVKTRKSRKSFSIKLLRSKTDDTLKTLNDPNKRTSSAEDNLKEHQSTQFSGSLLAKDIDSNTDEILAIATLPISKDYSRSLRGMSYEATNNKLDSNDDEIRQIEVINDTSYTNIQNYDNDTGEENSKVSDYIPDVICVSYKSDENLVTKPKVIDDSRQLERQNAVSRTSEFVNKEILSNSNDVETHTQSSVDCLIGNDSLVVDKLKEKVYKNMHELSQELQNSSSSLKQSEIDELIKEIQDEIDKEDWESEDNEKLNTSAPVDSIAFTTQKCIIKLDSEIKNDVESVHVDEEPSDFKVDKDSINLLENHSKSGFETAHSNNLKIHEVTTDDSGSKDSENLDDEDESKDRDNSLNEEKESDSKNCIDSVEVKEVLADSRQDLSVVREEIETGEESDFQLSYKYRKFGTIRKAISKQSKAHFIKSINLQDSIDIEFESSEKRIKEEIKMPSYRKEYILAFLRDEMGFLDCIKAAKEFEESLNFAQKSSKTAYLKSDDWKKFYLDISTLVVSYIPNQTIIVSKMAEGGDDIAIGEYFKNLNMSFNVMKNICSSCYKMIKVLKKNEHNEKIRESINRSIYVQHWNVSYRYDDIIRIITGRFKYYVDYLEKIICLTPETHSEHFELKKILDTCIIFWNTLQVCNKEKKAPYTRTLSFITGAVIILPNKTRAHRYIALFMDAFVIAEENQRSGVITVRSANSIKRCKIVQTPQKVLSMVSLPEEKLRIIKGSIAHNRHLIHNLEYKYRAKGLSKKTRHIKPLIEQESSLMLETAHYPLTLELSKKSKVIILFYNESDLHMWTKIINSRINNLYMEDWPIVTADLQKSVDIITDAVLSDNDKKGSDDAFREHNLLTTIFYTNEAETNRHSLDKKVNGLSGVLFCKLIFENKRTDKTDLTVNFQLDNYGKMFNKNTSQTIKCGETNPEYFRFYIEETTTMIITILKPKSNFEVVVIPAIDLIKEKIHRKQYKSLKYDNEHARLVVILEYSDDDDMQNPRYISTINHFQSSIATITKSEFSAIPCVMELCVEALKTYGLETQGLYRVSGVKSQILNLKKEWDMGLILTAEDLSCLDIHCVTGLLKMFLRDLEERIIPGDSVEKFDEINMPNMPQQQFESIINTLPRENKTALIFLMDHLMEIAKLQPQNKMGLANLVTVFAPNIFGTQNKKQVDNADLTNESVFFVKGSSIFKFLLQNHWSSKGFNVS